jgi:hypothetical protein
MTKRKWDRTSPSSHRHNHQGYPFSRLPEPDANASFPVPVVGFVQRDDFPYCLQGRYIGIGDINGEVVNVVKFGLKLVLRVSSTERRLIVVEEEQQQVVFWVSTPDQKEWDLKFVVPIPEVGSQQDRTGFDQPNLPCGRDADSGSEERWAIGPAGFPTSGVQRAKRTLVNGQKRLANRRNTGAAGSSTGG